MALGWAGRRRRRRRRGDHFFFFSLPRRLARPSSVSLDGSHARLPRPLIAPPPRCPRRWPTRCSTRSVPYDPLTTAFSP
jgi:hypothetical protein